MEKKGVSKTNHKQNGRAHVHSLKTASVASLELLTDSGLKSLMKLVQGKLDCRVGQLLKLLICHPANQKSLLYKMPKNRHFQPKLKPGF